MPLDPAPVPNELKGLRLALLVAGGIAAYKIVDLASVLTQAGAQVRVAMTASLRRRGVVVVEPESGHLASGHVGAGRLANASALMKAMADAVRSTYDLAGRRVVVTAGGTREPVDPVRYISNYSSGKMGFAIAAAAADPGARVTLVTTATHTAPAAIEVQPVQTAGQMLAAPPPAP